jgi:hypothetical protein
MLCSSPGLSEIYCIWYLVVDVDSFLVVCLLPWEGLWFLMVWNKSHDFVKLQKCNLKGEKLTNVQTLL